MNLLEKYNKINNILQESINLLNEEFINDKFYVYHGTPLKNLDSIFTFGFERYFGGSHVGELYGRGIYSTYDLDSTIDNLTTGKYGGKLIIKIEVFNLNKFIIYDKEVARKVYKNKASIKDQFELIFPKETIDELKRMKFISDQYESLYDFLIDETITYSSDQCIRLYTATNHFKDLKIESPYDNLDGFIFNGRSDGKVCIIKDFKNALPVEYTKDLGATWIKKESEKLKKYTLDDFDAQYRFGKKYKTVNVPTYGYSKVQNHKNKINYIDKSGKELSPFWFDDGSNFDEFPDGRIMATVRIEDGYFLLDNKKNMYLSIDDDEKYEISDFF